MIIGGAGQAGRDHRLTRDGSPAPPRVHTFACGSKGHSTTIHEATGLSRSVLSSQAVVGGTCMSVLHLTAADEPVEVTRYVFLGTWVDGFTVTSFVEAVAAWKNQRRLVLVGNHNVNSLVLYQRDPRFAGFYDELDANFIDGMAVVLLARLLGVKVSAEHRIAVLDWIWPLCARAEAEGWNIVHLGGSQAILDAASARLLERHPRLQLTTLCGFFDVHSPQANEEVLAKIRVARPSVLLIGMGMPRQELWLLENIDRLPPCVVVTVGGILSFIGGDRPTAPRRLGSLGLEWLFRLATEPRRLWRRYLIEPFGLAPAVGAALLVRLLRR